MQSLGGGAVPLLVAPGVVVLPGERTPLHITEPRYLHLVNWCLSEGELLAVAGLVPRFPLPVDPTLPGLPSAQEVAAHTFDALPRLFAGISVGRIAAHRYHPDGRLDVVVEHVAAGRIHREVVAPEPFRRATWRPAEREPLAAGGRVAALRHLAAQAAAGVQPLASAEGWGALSDDELVDALAVTFLSHPDHRRAYLLARSPIVRLEIVERAVASVVEHLSPAADA